MGCEKYSENPEISWYSSADFSDVNHSSYELPREGGPVDSRIKESSRWNLIMIFDVIGGGFDFWWYCRGKKWNCPPWYINLKMNVSLNFKSLSLKVYLVTLVQKILFNAWFFNNVGNNVLKHLSISRDQSCSTKSYGIIQHGLSQCDHHERLIGVRKVCSN